MNKSSSHFENQGTFEGFGNFNKENNPSSSHTRTQQKGFTQPPTTTSNNEVQASNLISLD